MPLKDHLKNHHQKVTLLIAPSDTCFKKSACVDVHLTISVKQSKSVVFFSFFLID